MAEFDEKLNSLLSNPDAMAQIMHLAQSLEGGSSASPQTPPPAPPPAEPLAQPPSELLAGLAKGVDPALLSRFLPLVQELGNQNSNARGLIYALRPYLKPERQEKVERALQLARLFHLGRQLLARWETR